MRKPGENNEPVAGIFETYYGDDQADTDLTAEAARSWDRGGSRSFDAHKSILIWQRYADPVWSDINQSDTLSFRMARDEHDERHISPLQLTPVRRCVQLWTNPGDVVLSPFTGIGTAGYVAIEMGRRFVGAELKPSYYRQAATNIRAAEQARLSGTLFDRPFDEHADALGSYEAAVKACGERYRETGELGDFFQSTREDTP